MLKQIFTDQVSLGLVQALAATVLALVVMLLARKREIRLESDLMVAMVRGLVQIVIMGSILLMLLRGPRWTSILILAGMVVAAAITSSRRAKGVPGAFVVSLYSIAFGSGLVIALMTATGAIDTAITSLIPIGSMVIANAMNTNSLALNRFRAEIEAHVGLVETALALGADSKQTVSPYVRASCQASLIPAIDSMRSLGIVWIPGLMTGMLLSGASPIYAAIYQFVILAMIFSASGLTCLLSTQLARAYVFSPAEQLILRSSADHSR